jgi:hypothetical protein
MPSHQATHSKMTDISQDENSPVNNTIRIHHSGVFDNALYGECDYDHPLSSRIEATIDGMPCNIKLESDVMPAMEQFSFYKSNPKETSLGRNKASEKKGTQNIQEL